MMCKDILGYGCSVAYGRSPVAIADQHMLCRALAVESTLDRLEESVTELTNQCSKRLDAVESVAELTNQCSKRLDAVETKMRDLDGFLGFDESTTQDFSLHANGATIIPELTFPTQQHPNTGPLPNAILEAIPLIGECWLFSGSRGHVAIQLSEPVDITSMSVNYVPFRQLLPQQRLRAPRSLILWGLIQGDLLVHFNASSSHRTPESFLLGKSARVPKHIDTRGYFIPLLWAEYDINHSDARQVFPIINIQSERAPLTPWTIVIIEVGSNWGADSTCLHHMGIHGPVF